MANELRKIQRVDQLSNSTLILGLSTLATTFVSSATELSINKQLNLGGNKLVNIATPTADTDAATKKYVDDLVAAAGVNVTDGTTTVENIDSFKVAGSGDIKAAVTAGAEGEAVITVSHELGEGTAVGNTGAKFIQDIKKTADGHVTEITTTEIKPETIGAQPAAAELTAIDEAGAGILVKTGDETVAAREITGEGAISVTNGNGVDGNPVVKVATASLTQAGVVQLSNDLVSESTTMALTAAQGKVLKDAIDQEVSDRGDAITELKKSLEEQISNVEAGVSNIAINGEGAVSVEKTEGTSTYTVKVADASTDAAGVVKLNNTLTSESTSEALTAAQGKALKDAVDGKLDTTGGEMTGALVLAGAPTSDNEAATKAYVDSVAEGLNIHDEVAVATTENITLSGLQTIDGYAVQAGDRVLVKDQTTATENGIYVAAEGAWTRAEDCDEDVELTKCYVFVANGATYASYGFSQVGTAVVGTTDITWTVFSRATKYSVVAATDSAASVVAEGSKFTIDIAKASTTTAGVVKLNNTLTSESTEEALTAAQGKVLKDAIDQEVSDREEAITTVSNAKLDKLSGAVEVGNLVVVAENGQVADAGVAIATGDLAETDNLVSGAQVKKYVDEQISAAAPTTVLVPVALELGTDATYTSEVVIPSGAYIESVNLVVGTPYEGTDVTISASVGEVTLIDATWNDPTVAGDYEGNSKVYTTGAATISVVVAGTPTAGAAELHVVYSKEVQA